MTGPSSGAVLPDASCSEVLQSRGCRSWWRLPQSLGSGWYNLSSTNSSGRRSIQRSGPVSDSRPVPPLQCVVQSESARSAGTSACPASVGAYPTRPGSVAV